MIPLFAFGFQLLFSLMPFVGFTYASMIGLIPWSLIALGVHYIHYQFGIGVVFNADESCYMNKKVVIADTDFYNDW